MVARALKKPPLTGSFFYHKGQGRQQSRNLVFEGHAESAGGLGLWKALAGRC